jgi:DNA invertase Pin-like site-specific DNA recombinase
MAKRVAIYARVSTFDQNSIPMQIRNCNKFIKSRKWKVTHTIKDVGSGAKLRPKREELLKLCRQKQVDIVVVWKLDRWGRSVHDIVSTLQELQILNIQFVSITEALDFTTPVGRAMSGLLTVFAEFERDMISERVKAGLNQARERGQILGRPTIDDKIKNKILKLWKKHRNKSLIEREIGISRRSIGRIIKKG